MTTRTIATPDTAAPGQPDPSGLLALARRSADRRMGGWPRRVLSSGERALMWLLRLYVFAMMAAVALQIVRLA